MAPKLLPLISAISFLLPLLTYVNCQTYCTPSLLQYCVDQWTLSFQDEVWINLSLQPMQPYQRIEWCSKFQNVWTTCLLLQLGDCTPDMVDELTGLYNSQMVLCHGMSDWEYEQIWNCLQLNGPDEYQTLSTSCKQDYDTAVESILDLMDPNHVNYDDSYDTGYEDICNTVKEWYNCTEMAALTSCGQKAEWFAADYLYQRNWLSMNSSLNCVLEPYASPATCDVTAADHCIATSQTYWNNNFDILTQEDAATQLAKLGGCLYESIDLCEESAKDQYTDVNTNNVNHITALSYNSTLTAFLGNWSLTGDESVACNEYTDIGQPERSTASVYGSTQSPLYDDTNIDPSQWYRFEAYTGSAMPMEIVAVDSCGNQFPVWASGDLPEAEFDAEIEQLPASTLLVSASVPGDDHFWQNNIKVKLCLDTEQSERYFVYNLKPLPSTLMTYCAGSDKPCDPDFEWNEDLSQCKQGEPAMTDDPYIQETALEDGEAVILCHISYPQLDDGARFKVTWYLDGVEIADSITVVSCPECVAKLPQSLLPAGALSSQVSCDAQSYWLGWDDRTSAVQTSNDYSLQVEAITSSTINEMDTSAADINIPLPLPVTCDQDSPIMLEILNSPYIHVDTCSLDLCNKDGIYLSVRAKKDRHLKLDGFNSQITFAPLDTATALWNSYQIPPAPVIIKDTAQASQCVVFGHGQVLGFDNERHHFYQSGTFIFWENDLAEIQLRLNNSVACGIAVRESDLVLGVDTCNPDRPAPVIFKSVLGSQQNNAEGYITVDTSGKNFKIHMPSGTTTRVYISTEGEQLFLSVLAEEPMGYGDIHGICMRGTTTDDINSNTYRVPATNNLFEDASASCDFIPIGTSQCTCEQGAAECGDTPTGNIVIPENWQSSCAKRRKRDIGFLSDTGAFHYSGYTFENDDSTINTEPDYSWPTSSGITEEEATEACEQAFYSSNVYQECFNVIDSEGLISACTQEIQVGDDLSLATSSSVVSIMENSCELQLEYDVVLGSEEEASQINATQEVTAAICPALCSGKGTCLDGTCVCDEGYVGSDCALDVGEAPNLWGVEETRCDIQQRPWQLIRVYGHGFWDSGSLACKITHVELQEDGAHTVSDAVDYTTAYINSAYEIMCEIPITPVSSNYSGSRKTEHGVQISVTTDGVAYSEHIMVVIYDSQCRACASNGVCSTLADTCHYDGVCLPVSDCDDPCVDYVDLGHPRRSTAYSIENVDNPTVLCDQLNIVDGEWYRFEQYTGGQMPESCVEPYHCATQSPIWLQGTHPTAENPGPVSATVCANRPSLEVVDSDCCDWSASVQVKYCPLSVQADSYHVYQLTAVPECEMAYCAGSGLPCEDGYDWDTDTQQCYEVNECLSNPCLHGNCTDLVNSFTCSCEPGYTDTLCQVDIDECALGSDCQNNGVCIDGVNGYTCGCAAGYAGDYCETEANECESEPCGNGGTCTDLFSQYTCQCAESFTGSDCLQGVWGEWSGWSGCSRHCGHGTVFKSRECASTAPCGGDSMQHAVCKLEDCQDTYDDENMEGAVLTIAYSDLEKVVIGELGLIDVLVEAMNFYCETHKYDFCESFGLDSMTMMMSPNEGMITAEHIDVKFITVEQQDTDPITMIQVIVMAQTDEITQYCLSPNDMTELPEQVHLQDTIVRDAIIQYTSVIQTTMDIDVQNVQTTADALEGIETETEESGSTKVPLIVAGAIFGTVSIIVAFCIARGIYRSKCVKERAKRTISKVSVNPIDGGPQTSRPTTPASLFSASSIKVDGRPLSGTSSRPHSGSSVYRPHSGTTRPYSGASGRPFSGAFGRPFSGLSRPSSTGSGRPMSGSSGIIIPPVLTKGVFNPRVTSIYEQVLSDRSNFSDGKRSAGHPTRISSINFEEMKPGSGAARCQRTLLLQKDPVLESDGLPAAAGNF